MRINKIIEFRYAISFISEEQARKSLQQEFSGMEFDIIKKNAKKSWEDVLGQIIVEGGTDGQRRTFYTALYRCYERMVDITEDGRYYSNYDSAVHESDREFYIRRLDMGYLPGTSSPEDYSQPGTGGRYDTILH